MLHLLTAIVLRPGVSTTLHIYKEKEYPKRNIRVKGKAIPLQALTGPEGSRRVRLQDFKTIGT
jgi:hypothetical protein